ncbi:uncharacterized protein [Mytilus edulis]|uniref:uncharacterized protein n=1 Tax=Mytilus edulis TaxID=6550 RepID=UPI0039F01563
MSLEDMDTNINKMISEIKFNKNSTEDCRGIIIQRMCEVREKVNKHLDTLEVRLKEELSTLETKVENDIQLTLKHLEEKKLQNATKQKQLKDLTTYTSNLQTFLGLRHLSSGVITDEAFLRSLVENRSLDEVKIEFEVDENIISLCNNINKFGSVKLRNTASNLRLESQKGKQAQTIEKRNSIENTVVKFVNTFQVNTTADSIYGCDVLPDGKMVFCNYSSESNKDFIAVFSSNSRHLYNISLEQNYAFDVVSLDDNTVVVTSPKPGKCCLMSVDLYRTNFTTTKTQFRCFNITLSEGKLISNAHGRGLISIDATSGNFLSTIKRNVPSDVSLTSFESKIYFCDPGKKTITCCDMEGKSIWTFKDDTVIRNPSGITVDGNGNVYVSNQGLNNVIVISADGTRSKQLLSESDGLKKPKAIQYDRKRNRLLVANLKEKAFLFDISN